MIKSESSLVFSTVTKAFHNRVILEDRDKVKKEKSIYMLYCNGVVVYVGQSVDVDSRVMSHRSKCLYRKTFDSYGSFLFSEVSSIYHSVDEAEADLIFKYQPIFNKNIPSNTLWVSLFRIGEVLGKGNLQYKRVSSAIECGEAIASTIAKGVCNYYNSDQLISIGALNNGFADVMDEKYKQRKEKRRKKECHIINTISVM